MRQKWARLGPGRSVVDEGRVAAGQLTDLCQRRSAHPLRRCGISEVAKSGVVSQTT